VIIRKLQESDLAALVALDMASFEKPWTEASLREELVHPDAQNWGDFANEIPLNPPFSKGEEFPPFVKGGLGGILIAAILTRLVGDERWIFRIMTHPDFRRQGLAQRLLEALPKEPLWLEVSEHNLSAIRFYEQAGFKIVSKRRDYYPEDAWVMRRM
jgi:ribosomal protein S18 acetylase RimI-like enzyme